MDETASSSSQPGEGELPYQTQGDVSVEPLPPASLFDYKSPLIEKIRNIYLTPDERSEPRVFMGFQAAFFYMLPVETLVNLVHDPVEVKSLGDFVKTFATRCRGGLLADWTQEAAATYPAARVAAQNPEEDPPATMKQHEENGQLRGIGKKRDSHLSQKSSISSIKESAKTIQGAVSKFGKRFRADSTSSKKGKTTQVSNLSDTKEEELSRARSKITDKRRRVLSTLFDPAAQQPEQAGSVDGPAPLEAKPPPARINRNQGQILRDIDERDGRKCVVSGKKGVPERSHIIPFTINDTTEGLQVLPPLLQIAKRLIGAPCTAQLQALLGGLGSSDLPWNVLTLTPNLHILRDMKGLIGFRPRYIEDDSPKKCYSATFTFYWLFKNDLRPKYDTEAYFSGHCRAMTTESDLFAQYKKDIVEHDANGGPIEDGKVIRVKFNNREDAVKMMRMLHIRWEAGILYCLAGGAGLEYSELLDGYDDMDSDSDGLLDENAMEHLSNSDWLI